MRGLLCEARDVQDAWKWSRSPVARAFVGNMTTMLSDDRLVSPLRVERQDAFEIEDVEFPQWDEHRDSQWVPSVWRDVCIELYPYPRRLFQRLFFQEEHVPLWHSIRVPLLDFEYQWLMEICKEEKHEARATKRRLMFLRTFFKRVKLDEDIGKICFLARLNYETDRFVRISRNGEGDNKLGDRYRLFSLEYGQCAELVERKVGKLKRLFAKRKPGMSMHKAFAVVNDILEEEDPELVVPRALHALIHTHSDSDRVNKDIMSALLGHFADSPAVIWRVIDPQLVKLDREEMDLQAVPVPRYPLTAKRANFDWKAEAWESQISPLKVKHPSPPFVANVTTADFTCGSFVSRALMASALLTANTAMKTHVLEITAKGQAFLWTFSRRDITTPQRETAHVLLYDEMREGIVKLTMPNQPDDAPLTDAQVNWIVKTQLAATQTERSQM